MSSSTDNLQSERPAPARRPRATKRPNSDINLPLYEPPLKKCRVEDEPDRTASPAKKEVAPGVGLHSLVSTLLESGKWSDLVIKCREKEWKAHRVVVCLPSKVLSTMIDSGFLEGTTGIIDLSDNEPDIVDCVIRFLYTNDYSYAEKSETTPVANTGFFSRVYSGQTLVINTKVYVLAEYLDLPALKKAALAKFASHLAQEGVSSGFTESLRIMYSETPESDRDLKDLALDYAIKHAARFLKREDFAAFCKDKESKEFMFEMLKETTGKAAKKKTLVRTRFG